MSLSRRLGRLLLLLWSLWPLASWAETQRFEHLDVALISELRSVLPGKPFWVAMRLAPEANWKVSWRNPGGAGLPTKVRWQPPPGMHADDTRWPLPERFEISGVTGLGYRQEVLLMARMTPDPDLRDGDSITVAGKLSWLVCNDICIPDSAELALTLPVSADSPVINGDHQALFEANRRRLPRPLPNGAASFQFADAEFRLAIAAQRALRPPGQAADFYPYQDRLLELAIPAKIEATDSALLIRQAVSKRFREAPEIVQGLLVLSTPDGPRGYELSASPGTVGDIGTAVAPAGDTAPAGLAYTLLIAFAGGLLLNLMPCVFPVLSLKAISLLESVKVSHHAQRLHGIAYTAGVVAFFLIVAMVLQLLRAGGEAVGWGFQLQAPWFVALLAYLLFVLGLGFSGLLEIGGRFMGLGQQLAQRGGHLGSFFTGALAAIVASPCTAPFMGSAIAVAATLPAPDALLIFVTLGLGMASPFLAVAFVPQLARVLPRPGPWMHVFKQAMAFPLYLTAIWLLWVLGRQTSMTGAALVLIGMLLLVFAIWLLRTEWASTPFWRHASATMAMIALLGALAIPTLPPLQSRPAGGASAEASDDFWVPYDRSRFENLRAAGTPVFINLTADWCISCIANERVALSFPAVRDAFRDKGVVPMKGDWTNGDPQITRILDAFGRSGVPLYVLYSGQRGTEPRVLSQWLTPMNVLEALDTVAAKSQ